MRRRVIGYLPALRLALLQMLRRKRRCLLTSLAISLAIAILAAPICLARRIYDAAILDTEPRVQPEVVLRAWTSSGDGSPAGTLERARNIEGVARVEEDFRLPMTLAWIGEKTVVEDLRALPSRWLSRWIAEGETLEPPGGVLPMLLGRRHYGPRRGRIDRETWIGKEVEVVLGELVDRWRLLQDDPEVVDLRRTQRLGALGLWFDSEAIERELPIRIRAPLLVIHGANDPRVPILEAEQIVGSLRLRGVPTPYLRFEDEGHGIVKLRNRLVAYAHVAQFIEKHLPHYCGFARRGPAVRLEWPASNMVSWFSQRITVGESEWARAFERTKIEGLWAYKPLATAHPYRGHEWDNFSTRFGNSSPRKSTSSGSTLPSGWTSVVSWNGRWSQGWRTAS